MPSLQDLYAAFRRIAPYTHRTPLLTSRLLDGLLGKRLLLKAEHLQKTGSFKARGALSKALALENPKGLLAVSSGNHAQGVAYAAQVLGVKALVVMPEDASPYKKACARAYGAEVVDRGVTAKNREEVARALQEETGYALIHPFDDPLVIAGQGTAGLELLAQAGRMGVFPGAVLAPVGGGGLLAGLATAVKALSPTTLVLGVEPEAADDAKRSLEAGRILRLEAPPQDPGGWGADAKPGGAHLPHPAGKGGRDPYGERGGPPRGGAPPLHPHQAGGGAHGGPSPGRGAGARGEASPNPRPPPLRGQPGLLSLGGGVS